MKRPNYNIDRNNVYKDTPSEQLPVDQAYVCKILSAKESNYDWGSRLEIAVDITEGDYKDFYKQKFEANTNEDKKWPGVVRLPIPKDDGSERDAWTMTSFNTNIVAIEDSNPGFTWDWDETKLKGKQIGLVLRNKEYSFNGRSGWYSEPFKFITVENARAGKFRKPKDKPLPNNSAPASAPSDPSGFINAGVDDDIPF